MKDKTVLGGSIIAAIAASFCCIGPLVAVVLGAGTLGAATAFEAARPYLLAMTAVLLAGAFYLTYRKREVACEDGACTVSTANRASKVMLWIVTAVVIAFATFPYYSGSLLRAQAAKSVPAPAALASNADSSSDERATIAVGGMTCDACAQSVRLALAKVSGVKSADVSYKDGRADVVYDPAATDLEKLRDAINDTGYTAGAVTRTETQKETGKPNSAPANTP